MKKMARWFGLFALLTAFVVTSAVAVPSKYVTEKETVVNGDTPFTIGATGPIYSANLDDLDEQMGDTLSIGTTYRDMQHNGTIGRMIGYTSEGTVGGTYTGPVVHVAWCFREGPETSSLMRYTKVTFNDADEPEVTRFNMDGSNVNTGAWAGYGVLYMNPGTNQPMISYHGPGSTTEYQSYLTTETSFMEFFFNPQFDIPNFNASLITIWPHMSMANYNGSVYAHILTNPQEGDNEDELFYHRVLFNGTTFENATPGGATAIQVTDEAMNLAGQTASSSDGSHVAIGTTVSRWLQRGSIPAGWDGFAISQGDNDIFVWESTDGGDTWDWDSPINVTNYTQVNPDFLPDDTTSANQDTFRCYTEVELAYDDDNELHVAFNAQGFDYYRETVSYTARLYYWNSINEQFAQIADGDFWKGARPAAWERIVCHANIEVDNETGVVWAMWQQYGEPSDTLIRNDTLFYTDISDDFYANAEIFVSASFDGGNRWMKGVNITNTKFPGYDAPAGECRSEREPSFVIGDGNLHVFYTLDLDAGIAVPSNNDAEGEGTLNPQVYHRVSMADVASVMWENAEYQRNYPLHFDENDGSWYQDGNDWAWDNPDNPYSGSVDHGETLAPQDFNLEQNYPNPFNPSTQIAFNLKKQGMIKLAVFDVLGREVATLVNRTMDAGNHKVTFMADELPSGVYFYKLTSGDASQVRKMVLMK